MNITKLKNDFIREMGLEPCRYDETHEGYEPEKELRFYRSWSALLETLIERSNNSGYAVTLTDSQKVCPECRSTSVSDVYETVQIKKNECNECGQTFA